MRTMLVVCCVLLCAVPALGREIAGVSIPERVAMDDGTELVLNGAGVRSKLFFKIYVAALYLEHPAAEEAAVLADTGRRRMLMHFLYDKVEREKLVEAWNEGFAGNLSEESRAALAERIDAFNAMFATVEKGDTIVLDYVPEQGTSVRVAGQAKGVIAGKDFSDALFSIWLGPKPVTAELKQQLLGGRS